MLDHLLALEPELIKNVAPAFIPEREATAKQVLDAKVSTQQWLKEMGAEDPVVLDPALERALAAQAFGAVTNTITVGDRPLTNYEQKEYVKKLKTPEAVQKVVGMLSEYEWQFVEEANKIRSYVVSRLLEETKNPKPEVRLKAYKMLGDVTEVALFTHRTEITTKNLTDEQLEDEIQKRLEKLTFNPDTPMVERVNSEVDDE
jgi:hypothetical protein